MTTPLTSDNIPNFDSLSSQTMTAITMVRNRHPVGIRAEVCYAVVPAIATVEIIISGTLTVASLPLYRACPDLLDHSYRWLKSSAFSFTWAFADLAANPFSERLVADEESARQMILNLNFTYFPPGSKY